MSVEKLNSPPIGRAYDQWDRSRKLKEYSSYDEWVKQQTKSKKGKA